MRKTKTVPVKEKVIKATTKQVETIYCDVCTEQIPKGARVRVCVLCKRDCHDWWNKQGCSQSDDRDHGDYPSYYCKFCHDLKFGKYDKEYWDLQEELEKKEDALERKILKESLQQSR